MTIQEDTMKQGVIGLFFALLISQAVEAGDWLEWRGPNRDGISAKTGLLQAWPEGGPRLVWTPASREDVGL